MKKSFKISHTCFAARHAWAFADAFCSYFIGRDFSNRSKVELNLELVLYITIVLFSDVQKLL